jgi:hypothetical protein
MYSLGYIISSKQDRAYYNSHIASISKARTAHCKKYDGCGWVSALVVGFKPALGV